LDIAAYSYLTLPINHCIVLRCSIVVGTHKLICAVYNIKIALSWRFVVCIAVLFKSVISFI